MEIEYNGISYSFKNITQESDEIFYNRIWFIIKNEPKNIKELDILEKYSKIWINIKYLKCKYNKELTLKINKLAEKFYN